MNYDSNNLYPGPRWSPDQVGPNFVSEYDFSSAEIGDVEKRTIGEILVIPVDLSVAQAAPLVITSPGRAFVCYGFVTASPVQQKVDVLLNIAIGDPQSHKFPAKHGRGYNGTFQALFITWAAQAANSANIVIFKSQRYPWVTEGL